MNKLVIINADDFGLSVGTNKAILLAFQKGILTSASLFATTPAYNDAIKIAKLNPQMGLGVHLSLTWGKAVSDPKKISDLVDNEGLFMPSYSRVILQSYLNKNFLTQIELEFRAQIEKVLSSGCEIDHLNSQQHIHMIPPIFQVTKKVQKAYNIKYLRVPDERFFLAGNGTEIISPFIDTNLIKYLLMKVCSYKRDRQAKFYGLLYTTAMSEEVVKKIISQIRPGITEILLHPAIFSSKEKTYYLQKQKALPFMKDKSREMELSTLLSPKISQEMHRGDIVLTNFRNLS